MTTVTVTPTTPTPRSTATGAADRRTSWAADVRNVAARELRPLLREPVNVLFAMVQPLVFLGLFAPLLPEVPGGSALQWFVPGIVTMTALMGASFAGAALMDEMLTGSHERMLVSPLHRSALLVGRAMKEVVPMLAQTALIVAVVTPFSFDLHLPGVLLGVAILALFSVGIGSLSLALGLVSRGREWMFWTVQQTVIFPILLLAGVLLPLDGAPAWLRAAAALNPMTYVIDAERALFAGELPVGDVLAGAGAAGLVAVLGLLVGVRAMDRAA